MNIDFAVWKESYSWPRYFRE